MNVFAIGAHPDDVELGCGGILALLKKKGHKIYILVLTKGEASGDPLVREKECYLSAEILKADKLFFGNLKDTKITDGIETIAEIEKVVKITQPEIVFSHGTKDRHQDHRNAGLATLSASRHCHKVLLYESPDALRNFCPQVFVDVSSSFEVKLKALEAFSSQISKVFFRGNQHNSLTSLSGIPYISNAVEGLARYRGFQASLLLAEAFEVGKFIWDVKSNGML